MKEIKLTQGQVALVDDEDYDYLMQWKWCAKKHRDSCYAWRSVWIIGKGPGKHEYMHRIIMNTPQDMETDHIDHNGLNNQKYNLRICNHRDNLRNRKTKKKGKLLGVFYDRRRKKGLYAKINVNKEQIYLGKFNNERDAAHAYDEAAKKYFGEFANLNFK